LGVTYKENIADTRETPIKFLIEELAKKQMNVKICDPLVVDRDLDFSNYEKIGIKEITFNEFDLIVIGRLHDEFKFINFNEIPTKVFNLGRKIPGPNIINL
jgi:UDP-N-acetyl-D-mannosaminuronate dehydrogenase